MGKTYDPGVQFYFTNANGQTVRVVAGCDTQKQTKYANYYTAFPGTQTYGQSDGYIVVSNPGNTGCTQAELALWAETQYPNRTR